METIKKIIAETVRQHYPDFSGDITLYINNNLEFGDYATSVAWDIAKQTNTSPSEVATKLSHPLAQNLTRDFGVEVEVKISSPVPFVNILLSPSAWGKLLDQKAYDRKPQEGSVQGKKYNLEFISANPTGPLTLANARGGYSGDAIGRVLEYAGANVEREYYYNDSGNQIMELGRSVLAAKDGKEIEGGYKGSYIKEVAEQITSQDPYEAGKIAAQTVFETMIKPMIERMNITFDRYTSEQSLMDNGTVESVIDRLKSADLTYEKDGALWLKTTQFGDDKDRVMQRSDEAESYTYLAKDIAYHWDKMKRSYTDLITIVGADHFAEAQTLERIVTQILARQVPWQGRFWQPIIQFVRLEENGQEVKMSKRAGMFVTIDDLLNQINSDVARFFFLMRDLNSHLDFDLSLARESSDKNPVYYVQYAYVRAKHILEKNQSQTFEWKPNPLNEEERRLLLHIHFFPVVIEEITSSLEIHKLTYYTMELAKHFHAFYAKHPVLQADGISKNNRLVLTETVFNVLQLSLALLGISHPEEMIQNSVPTQFSQS